MSGIAGIIHFDGKPVEPGLIEKMTGAMSYRGPDGINHWVKGPVALGQCMLRTTPESLEEHQPLTNEDESLVLVMDGRVDNWEELRRELLGRGAVLRNRSDAELVLRSYEVWGRDCLTHIDGDFSLLIWDIRRQEAFCARDRMGIRPFYYWRDKANFVISSDFHAIIVLPESPRKINEGMIAEHLAVRVDNLKETLITGISRLQPASFLIADNIDIDEHKYWDIDCHAQIHYRHESDYAEHFIDLFRETVNRQLRSITTVGTHLSGGIDSSSVACIAASTAGKGKGFDSFSLVFPGQDCDEQVFIEAVNQKYGLRGNCIPCTPMPFEHYVEQISQFMDVCDAPNGAMSNPLRSLLQNQGIRVVLTGYGGDEWFGQSGHYYAHILKSINVKALVRQFTFELKNGKSAQQLFNSFVYRGISPLIPENKRPLFRRAWRWALRKPPIAEDSSLGFVHPNLAARVSLSERMSLPERCPCDVDPAHRYTHGLLPLGWNVRGNEINDREIASYCLEERSPFHDRRMVEFAFALPEDQRSRDSGKHIIRESMQGILPESIRLRNDKAEFSGILAETLMGTEVSKCLTCVNLEARGWVDSVNVKKSYEDFCRLYKKGAIAYIDHIWPLWMALVLEVWISVMSKSNAH